jgi:hypothetical protein
MSTVRKRRRTKPVDDRPPYWMQEWLVHHEKSGRFDGREYRIYDVHASKSLPLSSACAEGVISRISDTALELREPPSVASAYAIWFGLLMAAPLVALLFYADIPQTISGTLTALWLVGMTLCAVAFGAHWIFMTFRELLRPSLLNVGILCDRRNQRLWWRDGGKDRWVAWDRIRVAYREGCPATQTSEDFRLLMLNKDDALVTTLAQGTEPLTFALPSWGFGHRCTQSHENKAGKAAFDFIAVFMGHGLERLPAICWRTPGHDRERLFLDLAHTLDFFAGPRAHASKPLRAFCAVLMALAAPLLLPPQWLQALAEFRRRPGEWSAATLQSIGVDPDSPATCLAAPPGSRPLHAPLDQEQRALAWIWIATAFAIYLIVGWEIVH